MHAFRAVIGGPLMHLFMRLFGHTGVTGWNWRSFGVAVLRSVILLVILHLVRGRVRLPERDSIEESFAG